MLKTKDKIVHAVIKKMDERSMIGQAKYGSTMEDEIREGKKDLRAFLTDVQEEIMDALLYIEAAKDCLRDEVEECYLRDIRGIDVDYVEAHPISSYWTGTDTANYFYDKLPDEYEDN